MTLVGFWINFFRVIVAELIQFENNYKFATLNELIVDVATSNDFLLRSVYILGQKSFCFDKSLIIWDLKFPWPNPNIQGFFYKNESDSEKHEYFL